MAEHCKKKNNHFVPRSYLGRFCSGSDREIALFNIKSSHLIPRAPIKSQCSRDYFYTKNPVYEDIFGKLEERQKQLLGDIIASSHTPPQQTELRDLLSVCVMLQAGRTVSTVEHENHITNQFGKAILQIHLEREGRTDLLEVLPNVEISQKDVVMSAIIQHLIMYPLINDLDCTLFVNKTAEDFLTSDHPISLCNSMPIVSGSEVACGFASRGLIILYPITPRALLFFSDTEVYKVEKNADRMSALTKKQDVIELNLAQFRTAFENVYFSNPDRVRETLCAFQKHSNSLRPPPPTVTATTIFSQGDRQRVLIDMPATARRLHLPRAVKIRRTAKIGKYQLGDRHVRDPLRARAVSDEIDRINTLRENAINQAKCE